MVFLCAIGQTYTRNDSASHQIQINWIVVTVIKQWVREIHLNIQCSAHQFWENRRRLCSTHDTWTISNDIDILTECWIRLGIVDWRSYIHIHHTVECFKLWRDIVTTQAQRIRYSIRMMCKTYPFTFSYVQFTANTFNVILCVWWEISANSPVNGDSIRVVHCASKRKWPQNMW